MKRMHSFMFGLMTVTLTASMLMSCASAEPINNVITNDGSSALHVTDEDKMAAIFNLSDADLDVASYRLRGEGPDGASFDWIEVTEPRVAIADVRRGQWTLYAQALNADGDVLVAGKIDTFLSEDSPVDNLVFAEHDGEGQVYTDITWNRFQAVNPNVEVYLKPVDGEFAARPASEVSFVDDHMVWQASGLEAGSYIARFVFKDGSSVIGGASAALRVIADYTSVGNVEMNIGNLSTVYGITLDNLPDVVTLGELKHADGVVTFEGAVPSGAVYEWYVNGNKMDVASAPSFDITAQNLPKGVYRVDLVVRGGQYGSIASYMTLVQLDHGNNASTVDGAWTATPIVNADATQYEGVTFPEIAPAVDDIIVELDVPAADAE